MKKFLILLGIISTSFIFSQEGLIVTYQETQKYYQENKGFDKLVEIERDQYQLRIIGDNSNFLKIEKINNNQLNSAPPPPPSTLDEVKFIFSNQNQEFYLTLIDYRRKPYIIKDTPENTNWNNVEDHTEEILGYSCKLMVRKNSDNSIDSVFYTPKIKKAFAPGIIAKQKGLVLKWVHKDAYKYAGTTTMQAIAIEEKKTKVEILLESSSINREEWYDCLRQDGEKMNEFYEDHDIDKE